MNKPLASGAYVLNKVPVKRRLGAAGGSQPELSQPGAGVEESQVCSEWTMVVLSGTALACQPGKNEQRELVCCSHSVLFLCSNVLCSHGQSLLPCFINCLYGIGTMILGTINYNTISVVNSIKYF